MVYLHQYQPSTQPRGVMKGAVKWTSTDVDRRWAGKVQSGRCRPLEKGSIYKLQQLQQFQQFIHGQFFERSTSTSRKRQVEKCKSTLTTRKRQVEVDQQKRQAGRRRPLGKGRLKKAGRCRPVEKGWLQWLTSTTAFFSVDGRQLFSSRPFYIICAFSDACKKWLQFVYFIKLKKIFLYLSIFWSSLLLFIYLVPT